MNIFRLKEKEGSKPEESNVCQVLRGFYADRDLPKPVWLPDGKVISSKGPNLESAASWARGLFGNSSGSSPQTQQQSRPPPGPGRAPARKMDDLWS